jgi:hypothetical protein
MQTKQTDEYTMPKIYNLKEPFDLGQLRMTNPVSKNGAHFIKTLAGEEPLYFLAPKCSVKQGFVSHGKKVFCDFVFSNEDSSFLSWLENLEETSRAGIFANREKWFETPLDEHDIESSMTSPYKSYKSGKYFIVRANVPTALGKINIKVYDEKEQETEPESIKENTNVMVVMEFQGIKCSARSFQFEIVLKQMLVVEPDKLFEKCIIPKASTSSDALIPIALDENPGCGAVAGFRRNAGIGPTEEDQRGSFIPNSIEKIPEPVILEAYAIEASATEAPVLSPAIQEEVEPSTSVIEVVDVDLVESESEPPIQLKKRNDVYYKLYKEAREKAREAKQVALANYLEAKRIKNTYLLEDMSESEEDDDENLDPSSSDDDE